MQPPEQLRITWARGAEFLAAYDRQAGRYTVSVPHSTRVLRSTAVGEQLLVEHQFADSNRAFRHVARVVDHSAGPPEVVTLEFVESERAVRDLVVCHAEGQSVPYLNRRAERRPVWLPVELAFDSDRHWRHGIITELSELGAFITTKQGTPEGKLALRIPLADGARLEVPARSLYDRYVPEPGFAVEFIFETRDDEVRVQRALGAALQAPKRS